VKITDALHASSVSNSSTTYVKPVCLFF